MTTENKNFIIDDALGGIRLDKALATLCPEISRAQWQRLILDGQVTLDNHPAKDGATKTRIGQQVDIVIPPPKPAYPQAQKMALNIVFEDEHLLVIDKPVGLVVHPGAGNSDETMVNGLLAHCGDSLSGIGGVARPGIVHRLDKDTSGLMVVAKHDAAHQALSAQFMDRSLSRVYQALVRGRPMPPSGRIDTLLGRDGQNRQKMAVVTRQGKQAITDYRVITSSPRMAAEKVPVASLIECTLQTGRTHQIRVHMAHIGHPILGDPAYGHSTRRSPYARIGVVPVIINRQALHAVSLFFVHPMTDEEMVFDSPLADDIIAQMVDLDIVIPSESPDRKAR